MTAAVDLRISVGPHAIEAARKRVPEWRQTPYDVLVDAILAEIRAAIADGRMATRKPRFLVTEGRRPRSDRATRFAWTDDESRCYVLMKKAMTPGDEPKWVVKTVMTAPGARRLA